jgi:hypothetical protein
MCPTASYDDLLYRSSAVEAGFTFAAVDAVQHLKISAIPVGVHVI